MTLDMHDLGPAAYLTVYKHPSRDEFLRASRDGPAFFDGATRAWIITNPELCREMLASPNLLPAPMAEKRIEPGTMARRLAEMTEAIKYVPLFLSGEEHAALRRRVGEYLASRRAETSQWIERELPRFVEPFARPGRFDVVAEVLEPMLRDLMQTMIGMRLPAEFTLSQTSQVFDRYTSVSQRGEVGRDLTKLQDYVRAMMGPQASEDEIGVRLGLLVVGSDPTLGTFGESLVRLLRDADGQPLNQIAFPKFAPQTGIPFVERIVETAFSAEGIEFEKGARLRIVLQTYSLSPPEQHHRFFGAGVHSCLGRPAATELWSAFGALLRQLSTRVRVLSYEVTENVYVFNIPRLFMVEVTT
jgi:cytochrome P450